MKKPNLHLVQTHKLRKLYARLFDIGRFTDEKRVPYSGVDIENITDPTAMVHRDRVSVWFDPKVSGHRAKVPHDDAHLVFRGYHEIAGSGYFKGKPQIDRYTPGPWEEIVDIIWDMVKSDEAKLRGSTKNRVATK